MNNKLIVFPLFFFLFLTISAYATPDVNVTVKLGSLSTGMIRCINSTDNAIYCYMWSVEAAPTYTNKLVRLNATGGNQTNCTLTNYTSAPISSRRMMALLNATHMILRKDDTGCDVWNITDIGGTNTCTLEHHYTNLGGQCQQMMFAGDDALFGANPTDIYTEATGSLTPYYISQANYSNFTAGWWNKTIYWNSTSKPAYEISVPDRSASTIYVTSHAGHTWYYPPFLKYTGGSLESVIASPYPNETMCDAGTYACEGDLVKNGSVTYLFTLDNYYDRFYRINFTAYESDGSTICNLNGNQYHVGTQCIDATTYATTLDNCTVNYTACAAGTFCQQMTPQLNVTNDLIENYTQCAIYYKIGGWTRCSNICWNGQLLYSNCQGYPDNPTECSQCPTGANGFIIVNAKEGYYTNTWYSNQSTVSVPSWAIACVNQTSMGIQYVIDNKGTNTTEIGLLTQAGNNVSANNQSTAEVATPLSCSSTAGAAALFMGGLFGITSCTLSMNISSIMFTLIISMIAIIILAYYGIGGKGLTSIFMFMSLLLLTMFAISGWFPIWLIVILIVISALGVAGALGGLIGG